ESVPGSAPPPPEKPGIRLNRAAPEPASSASTETPSAETGTTPCPKHPRQIATAVCCVCQKPICQQCMELFGYLCSPACRSRAEVEKIPVPKCLTQKSVVQARQWRKAIAATI